MDRREAEALYQQIPETPVEEFYLLEPEFCRILYYQIPAQQRPPWATAFLTIVNWFAMSQRNGVWTFYEATPARQIAATLDYLNQTGDRQLAAVLQSGAHDYQNPKYAGNWDYPEE